MKDTYPRNSILAFFGVLVILLAGCGGGGGGDNGNNGTGTTGTTTGTATGGQPQTTTITGVLKDTKTGIVLRNLVVTVQGTTLKGTSGSIGGFTIANVPLATETLVVTDTCGHSVGQQTVDVSAATQTSNGRDVGTLSFSYLSGSTGVPPPPCL